MKAITYRTHVTEGVGVIDRVGYPTGTPGLLVTEAYASCDVENAPEWMVVHARTGLVFPFCWDSPEAALAFAEKAGTVGDWQQDREATKRLTDRTKQILTEYADALGGGVHQAGGPAGMPIDNGVIA